MNKKQVQQKVLQNGKPLALSKFTWCEKTMTFSSDEDNLVFAFQNIEGVKIISRDWSIQTAGYNSTQTAGNGSTQKAGHNSTQKAGAYSTQTAGAGSTQKAGHNSTQTAGAYSTQTAGAYSTQKAGAYSTQTAGAGSTHFIDDRCQVATGYESIIHVNGNDCAIINRNVFELIQPKSGDIIQISPDNIGGHLVNGIHSITGKKSIIADGILSEVISKKGNVYKVINHGKTKPSYLIESEVNDKKVYSHGKTLKEARESLIYKLSDRDSSQYKDLTLDSVLSKEEAIKCYMTITGACISGTKYFVDRLKDDRKELSVEEIINLTQGQYGHDKFKDFFNNT